MYASPGIRPWRLGTGVIASAYRTEDPEFDFDGSTIWMTTKNRRHFDGRLCGCRQKIADILMVGNLGVGKKLPTF
jgi:hypothetical protein